MLPFFLFQILEKRNICERREDCIIHSTATWGKGGEQRRETRVAATAAVATSGRGARSSPNMATHRPYMIWFFSTKMPCCLVQGAARCCSLPFLKHRTVAAVDMPQLSKRRLQPPLDRAWKTRRERGSVRCAGDRRPR